MTTGGKNVFQTRTRLILASGSPRRKKLLQELGLDFETLMAPEEEKPRADEDPQAFVLRAAAQKAKAVSHLHPDAWVLGADTVVVLGKLILGKPVDSEDAARMVNLLSGKTHTVLTAFCLCKRSGDRHISRAVSTEVAFAPFSGAVTSAYVRTGEPLDKAGGYGIQGLGGFLIETINGSYSNVVGLPLAEVIMDLLAHGVISPVL